MAFLQELLASNQLFSAGAGLIGVTASLALLRQGAIHANTLARRTLLCSLEIPSKDHSYNWFLTWLAAHNHGGAQPAALTPNQLPAVPSRKLASLFSRSPYLSVETAFIKHDNGSTYTRFNLVPGMGSHYFNYRGAWFHLQRSREKTMIDLKSGTPWETITITTLSAHKELFTDLLTEAKTLALVAEKGKTVVYTSVGPDWRMFGHPRRKRAIDSVVLDKGISEELIDDVQRFLRNGKWYYDRGIPYRRGYLLYGPPGSGKTSFILALAGHLDYNICALNLSDRGLTDDRLSWLLSSAPPRSIILLEDVDAAFVDRKAAEQAGQNDPRKQGFSMVTLSGLLNALDGVASSEERIVFMTTNHVERLDAALIRPGRVDVRRFLGDATPHQIREMFSRFYPFASTELVQQFVDGIAQEGRPVSTAQLQGHFVVFADRPEVGVKEIGRLWDEVDMASKINIVGSRM